jgi:hypothetical protein
LKKLPRDPLFVGHATTKNYGSGRRRWIMKKLAVAFVFALLICIGQGTTPARAQDPGYYPGPHGGYTYIAPHGWAIPPAPYYGGYGFGYGPSYWRALPPYGFGSPYYNGYNDPYYYSYGRGVRDFLRMGGADFYGW